MNGPRGRRRSGAWWRSWVRDLVVLVVVVEFLAWLVHRSDASGTLLRHWPPFAPLSIDALGMIWIVGRIDRAGPSRQALPIAGLIVSVLGLGATTLVYASWMYRDDH